MEKQVTLSKKEQKKQILIVTGLSGAGKNVVMRALEDLGFYCVDNLPVPLVSTFLRFAFQSNANLIKVALGIDARGEKFLKDFLREIDALHMLEDASHALKIVFLQASDQTLIRRFEETRRKHPLAKGSSLSDAFQKEKALLAPIIDRADIILDTDTFNIHELRRWVRNSFADSPLQEIVLNFISFGFKYGIPSESNLLYDVRFLPNPYFIPALKAKDGTQQEVQQFLFEQAVVGDYTTRLLDFLNYSVQKYLEEGRPFVNIAIGCTGGKHRSVSIVEWLSKRRFAHARILIYHRDINKT